MARYLLDTNHMRRIMEAASPLRERIISSHQSGNRFGTCLPVLCEIKAGIQRLARYEELRRWLGTLFRELRLWSIQRSLSVEYGRVYNEMRSAGRALSQIDMMLAAMARTDGMTLLTADRDFEAVATLDHENWL